MTPEMRATALAVTLLEGWEWPRYMPVVVTEVYGEEGTRERRGVFLSYGRNLGKKGHRLVVALPPISGEEGQVEPANIVEVTTPECIPDLTDPAAAGLMLEMLTGADREMEFDMVRDPSVRSRTGEPSWCACICPPGEGDLLVGWGPTFSEAVADLALRRGKWS